MAPPWDRLLVMEKLLLNIYDMFCRLVGCYCSCLAAPLMGETSQIDVSRSYSVTIPITLYRVVCVVKEEILET